MYNEYYSSITQTEDGKIWIVWDSGKGGNDQQEDLFYKTSSDEGTSWSQELRLTQNTFDDFHPCIFQTADKQIWLFGTSNKEGTYDIYYSTFKVDTWSSAVRLTDSHNNEWTPSAIQASDSSLWIFYNKNQEIFYKNRKVNTWSPEIKLPCNENVNEDPNIIQVSNDRLWIVFHSQRANNYDLYAIVSNLTPFVTVVEGSIDIAFLPPFSFYLDQNFPNPFNLETSVSFALSKASHIKLSIYNILGQKIKTLIDKNMNVGNHVFRWDSRDNSGNTVTSGIYFYRIEAKEFSQMKKMILMK